jgi:hypothetical protein
MKTFSLARHLLAALVMASGASHAAIVTNPAELSPDNMFVTFESFSIGNVPNPLAIGSATFSSAAALTIEDVAPYNPAPHASGKVLRANDGPIFSLTYTDIRIDFSEPVSEVGLGWWDSNLAGNLLKVYNAAGELLESAEVPTGSPGGSFAPFIGIRRNANEIAYAIASVAANNEVYGIDNVSFGANVPEPSSALLVLASGALFLRRRRST